MSFEFQPLLSGSRVRLRPLLQEDFSALRQSAADPLIWEQHPAKRFQPDVFEGYFTESLESSGALIVEMIESGEVIGSSRYHGYDEEESVIEIGWTFLVRKYWGSGINAEIKAMMLKHAFQFVDSVIFLVAPENIRSQTAVQKIGAVREGTRLRGSGTEDYLYRIRKPHE
ncbi:MAG: GNAT family N-acetyltransferase [Planctomycetota bacterium]